MNIDELRDYLYEAQGSKCAMPSCQSMWTDMAHIRAASLGGPREPSNLLGLCRTCHQNFDQHRRVAWEEAFTYLKLGLIKEREQDVQNWWQRGSW